MAKGMNRKLTTEVIAASAAKHTRRSDWSRADRSAYTAAAERGLLDTVCAHMQPVPPKRVLSLEQIRASAAQYPSRAAWERGDASAYYAAKRRGLMDEVCQHMPRSPRKLTLETLKASAAPFKHRIDWIKADQSAYICARERGVLDQVCAHMVPKPSASSHWTLEDCKASAARFSSRRAWEKGEGAYFRHARANGWLDECCAHMRKGPYNLKWTRETITTSAKRYSTKTAWHREASGAYVAAKRLGIFEEVTAHMQGGPGDSGDPNDR
jgi:hypothetical protein